MHDPFKIRRRDGVYEPKEDVMTLSSADIETLSAPFDEKTIGIKVQSFNKEKTKAMLVAYVQHTDVYARIEQIDPAWSFQVTSLQPIKDGVSVRGNMTIKGVTRENAGEGGDEKSAISDCIKRCAMLFGVGRYLYDSETVWVEYNDQRDKYRNWTYQDYAHALKRGQAPLPVSPQPPQAQSKPRPVAPRVEQTTVLDQIPSRNEISIQIANTAKQIGLNKPEMVEWLFDEFKEKDPKNLTDKQLARFLEILQGELGRKGEIA